MTMFSKLYKVDSKGKVRVWWMEVGDGGSEDSPSGHYRTHSGLEDGAIVVSAWKKAEPKNVGRSNETTSEVQAVLEVESLYRDKKTAGTYSETKGAMMEEKYFEPMLATRFDQIKNVVAKIVDNNYAISQPKLDGIRCTISVKSGMISRNGRAIVSSPHIMEALKPVFAASPDIVLDGELYNHEFHDNFNKLQSLIMQPDAGPEEHAQTKDLVQYHIYDMFSPGQPESTTETRDGYLNYLRYSKSEDEWGPIVFVKSKMIGNEDDIDAAQAEYLEQGYEGQIIRLDTAYEKGKRSKNLIKRKEWFDEEFEILRFEEGVGNWAGAVKRVVLRDRNIKTAEHPEGIEFEAGVRGSYDEMAALLLIKDKYVGSDATIRFPNKTPAGKPRFGVMIRYYEGKRDF